MGCGARVGPREYIAEQVDLVQLIDQDFVAGYATQALTFFADMLGRMISIVRVAMLSAGMALGTVCCLAQGVPGVATGSDTSLPHIDRTGAHPTLIVDGEPFLMLGAQVNNSSAWAASMPTVWPAMDTLGVNTVEAPVYWETLEPTEGRFDYGQVDMLLQQARAHHVRLVLLWFGTWKNGSPGYTPHWVKLDEKRFPLAVNKDGGQSFSLSPFGTQTLAADAKAFTALMGHLKTADPQHTVIVVQVENETGMWGNRRDYSPAAEKLFAEPVPDAVRKAMGKAETGDWTAVFGKDAAEHFYAWAIARYVNHVAEAGKAADPLPMYVNAALKDPLHDYGPGSFESGAPVYDALPVWHAMAPALDAIAPDIYMPEYANYMAVIQQYALLWNPFFVPETGNSEVFAHYFFSVLGAGGFGWAPFGMDETGYANYPLGAAKIDAETLAPFALNYAIAGPMMRELAKWGGQDRVRGSAESPDVHEETLKFGNKEGKTADGGRPHWTATVQYGLPSFGSGKPAPGNAKPEGEALVVELGPDEFLVSGAHCRVDFNATATSGKHQRLWLSVEEGQYTNGKWTPSRLWNGDQTDYGLNFTYLPQVLRVKLARY
jgi:beta-galactosidase GanA